MDWDCGFSTNSPEFLLLGEKEMEELRSEKTVTASKASKPWPVGASGLAHAKEGVAGTPFIAHRDTKRC